LTIDCANQPHEGVDLLRNSRPVGTEVLLQANSAKEREDQAGVGNHYRHEIHALQLMDSSDYSRITGKPECMVRRFVASEK
jgi:hypothetical protein